MNNDNKFDFEFKTSTPCKIFICDILTTGSKLAESAKAKAGLEDMALLLRYCNLYGCRCGTYHNFLEPVSNSTFSCSDSVSFDLSLARGLDYYTGVGRLEQ